MKEALYILVISKFTSTMIVSRLGVVDADPRPRRVVESLKSEVECAVAVVAMYEVEDAPEKTPLRSGSTRLLDCASAQDALFGCGCCGCSGG